MTAAALAMPSPLPTTGLLAPAAPVAMAPAAGLALLAATCVEQTADLMRLACRRGQLEDASTAARIALPLAARHSPHEAMLRALGETHALLMQVPEERQLYLLRQADGNAAGVLRLRDNGQIGLQAVAGAQRWTMRDGNLELCNSDGHAIARFVLCGERAGLRVYLGESLPDGAPRMLQEVRCTYDRLSLLDPELADPFCSLYDVDAIVPADLPDRATVLLGAPHSRTTQLSQALNAIGDVFFDGELLHPQAIGLAEGLLSPAANATLHAMRAKDAPWFVRMMLGRHHDAQGRDLSAVAVRGFTFAPSHDPVALQWMLQEPTLRVVHVVRSNQLAEFADILASQAGAPAKLHFEPERFGRFIEMKQRYLESVRKRLVARPGDTVEVDGSRLNALTMAELLGFLTDNTDTASLAVEAVPVNPQRVIDRFANPDAVIPCLRALGRMSWADTEGTSLDVV